MRSVRARLSTSSSSSPRWLARARALALVAMSASGMLGSACRGIDEGESLKAEANALQVVGFPGAVDFRVAGGAPPYRIESQVASGGFPSFAMGSGGPMPLEVPGGELPRGHQAAQALRTWISGQVFMSVRDSRNRGVTLPFFFLPSNLTFDGGTTDAVADVALDPDGATYVLGLTNAYVSGADPWPLVPPSRVRTNVGPNADVFVQKLDRFGRPVLTTFFGISSGQDTVLTPASIVVDPQTRDFYIAGHTGPGIMDGGVAQIGAQDAFIVKFNAQGGILWVKRYGVVASSMDWPKVVLTRERDPILIFQTPTSIFTCANAAEGFPAHLTGCGQQDWAVVRLSALSGVQAYAFEVGTPSNEWLGKGKAAVVDESNRLWIVGRSAGAFDGTVSSGNGGDVALLGVDLGSTASLPLFEASGMFTVPGPGASFAQGNAISIGMNGNLIIAGNADGAFEGGTVVGSSDSIVFQADPNFATLDWLVQFGNVNSDTAMAARQRSDGKVLVVGRVDTGVLDINGDAATFSPGDLYTVEIDSNPGIPVLAGPGRQLLSPLAATPSSVEFDAGGYATVGGAVNWPAGTNGWLDGRSRTGGADSDGYLLRFNPAGERQ